MTDLILTSLPLLCCLAALAGVRKSPGVTVCSKDNSLVIKGVCAVIVIFVHVPAEFGNALQDAAGSFAFVCVTVFFAYSAYGMLYSLEHRGDYLRHFWRNRLSALLVPCLLINAVAAVLDLVSPGGWTWQTLFHINDYVLVLLQWCVCFYVAAMCARRYGWPRKALMVLLSSLVLASSLVSYLAFESKDLHPVLSGWCYERMGLVWGILAYAFYGHFGRWLSHRRTARSAALGIVCLASGVLYLKLKCVFFAGEYLLKLVLGFAIVMLLAAVLHDRRLGNPFSCWLGRISYEVYLGHLMVIPIVARCFPDIGSGMYVLVVVLATLLVAAAVNPLSRLLAGIIRR